MSACEPERFPRLEEGELVAGQLSFSAEQLQLESLLLRVSSPNRIEPLSGPFDTASGNLQPAFGQHRLVVGARDQVLELEPTIEQGLVGHPAFDIAKPLLGSDGASRIEHLGELDVDHPVGIKLADGHGSVAGSAGNETTIEHVTAELPVAARCGKGRPRTRTRNLDPCLRSFHLRGRRIHHRAVLQRRLDRFVEGEIFGARNPTRHAQ